MDNNTINTASTYSPKSFSVAFVILQCVGSSHLHFPLNTAEPRSTDTRLIRTPVDNRQFRLSRRKVNIFSLKLTRLIWKLLNMDNGHFPVSFPCSSALQTLSI